jgi:shikimate kinase
MKIVLIGFMATGKSSVAPKLAARLGVESVEMDDLIVEKAGKSIKDIFATDGESAFRELEEQVAQDLQAREDVVISTGGGVVTNQQTMQYLAQQGLVVELSGSFETILKRIDPAMPRPLFKDTAEAKALYEQRRPLYSKYATIRVATDNQSVEAVVEAVAHELKAAKKVEQS